MLFTESLRLESKRTWKLLEHEGPITTWIIAHNLPGPVALAGQK